ncbi:hypothetical protein M407DRAFT_243895 [Tulasnella calospora MUT 4182]|uniref:Uncharacterized protein n=1 Tax=Tulasnella calospora MUT 4182 TaxID=1051891 RepID=A0A0C3QHH2_9AGAM|nr:hypothetical protein M407DRAFT_243895 [Tulasnella calospora MUT 4182]
MDHNANARSTAGEQNQDDETGRRERGVETDEISPGSKDGRGNTRERALIVQEGETESRIERERRDRNPRLET